MCVYECLNRLANCLGNVCLLKQCLVFDCVVVPWFHNIDKLVHLSLPMWRISINDIVCNTTFMLHVRHFRHHIYWWLDWVSIWQVTEKKIKTKQSLAFVVFAGLFV